MRQVLSDRDYEKIMIPSGFPSLDRITGGFRPGELTIIGARPSIGKSAFLRDIVRNLIVGGRGIDMEFPVPVAFFSPGWTSFQLSLHFILQFLEREPRAEDFPTLRWRMMSLDKAPLHIDDTPNITARDFRSRAAGLVKKNGVRLIAVDYLQQMHWSMGGRRSRKAETAAVVRCLKETAEELNVPVIALSGLRKKNGCFSRPRIGDLKYAPVAIDENADVICLMWRRDNSVESETVVTVAKNSKGQTGDVRFNYNPAERYSFIEIETVGIIK